MARTKAFLLAAGLGTRLGPLTYWVPKCLVTVAGRPMLAWWVKILAQAGVRDALVNTHSHAHRVREFLRDFGHDTPVSLHESYEPVLLGSAGAITANAAWADDADDIILINADNFGDVDLGRLLAFHRSHNDPMTMMLYRSPTPSACGIAELSDDGRVVAFVEKPLRPTSNLANAGIYIVRAAAYREIAALVAFDLGHDVLPSFVGRMRGWVWDGYQMDIGTPAALDVARRDAPGLCIAGRRVRPLKRKAVFLDRDGTLIEDVPYLGDPARVRLLRDAAEGVRLLRAAGYSCVVVTNQSGIGRGLYSEDDMRRVNDEMRRQLVAEGADLDGLYHCPVAPTTADRTANEHPRRKPGPGMLLEAARDLELNLSESWMVGDLVSDTLAGRNAGCKGSFLLGRSSRRDELLAAGCRGFVAPDLRSAARAILRGRCPNSLSA